MILNWEKLSCAFAPTIKNLWAENVTGKIPITRPNCSEKPSSKLSPMKNQEINVNKFYALTYPFMNFSQKNCSLKFQNKVHHQNVTINCYYFFPTSNQGSTRHGTRTMSRKMISPRDQVSDFFTPRDSPAQLSPVISGLSNLGLDPRYFRFQSRSQSRIFCGIP